MAITFLARASQQPGMHGRVPRLTCAATLGMPFPYALAEAELAEQAAARHMRRADAAYGVRCWRERVAGAARAAGVLGGPDCRLAAPHVRPHVQGDRDARPITAEAFHRLLKAPVTSRAAS